MLVILHYPTACHKLLIDFDASAILGVYVVKKSIVLTRHGFGRCAHQR